MADKARDIANRIDGRPPRPAGHGNWLCRCPAHDDRTPSLSIKCSGGKLVYHCHAGCSFDMIAAAIRAKGINPFTGGPDDGWRPGDRRATSTAATPRGRTADDEEDAFRAAFRYDPARDPDWAAAPGAHRPPPNGYGHLRYVYRDRSGLARMLVHRYDKIDPTAPGKRKEIIALSPWTRASDGRLVLPPRPCPAPRPPYGSEALGHEGTVWVVEGEKCRDMLHGLLSRRVPVISLYGSNPGMSDLACLTERPTIVMPDFDAPGEHYAVEVLGAAGKRATSLPSTWRGGPGSAPPAGWDVADDITGVAGFTPLTAREFVAHVAAAAAAEPEPGRRGLLEAAAREATDAGH